MSAGFLFRIEAQSESRRRALRWSATLAWLILAGTGWAAPEIARTSPPPTRPMSIGIDMAGSYHLLNTDVEYWSHAPYWRAVDELGAQFIGMHLFPRTRDRAETPESMSAKLRRIDAGMRAHGRQYMLNGEDSNFWSRAEVFPGVNEYDAPAGCHRWDLRREWFEPLLEANATRGTAFIGWVYDEVDHMQITNNQFVNLPAEEFPDPELNVFDAPHLADTHGLTVEAAWSKLVAACAWLRDEHFAGEVPVYSEQVVPDLFPVFARSGWRVTPKLLMESFSSMIMSTAMGAALESADRAQLWVLCDLHGWLGFPGHSPEALRSALTMAYWLGADGVYVENLDWVEAVHHPDADPGGLIRWSDADHYQLTRHGAVFKEFATTYVPAHPRAIDWRDYRPRVAIVRLPDGDWGLDGQPWFRNRLLGNRDHPSNAISREWLKVWPILTHGRMRSGAASLFNDTVYPEVHSADTTPDFFVPIDSVAVFDHMATGPVLDSVDCFVVCGHAFSGATFEAIRARVADGATCIVARRLFNQFAGLAALPGDWLVVDDFRDPRVVQALEPFLGESDVARFRFKDAVVEFRPGAARDSITARLFDRALIADFTDALAGGRPAPPDSDLNGDGRFDVADLVILVRKFESRRRTVD